MQDLTRLALTTYDPSYLTTMMVYPTVQFWTFELLQLMI